jgi:type 1 fimbria pilin
MKKTIVSMTIGAALLCPAFTASGQEGKMSGGTAKEITVTGEVVDLNCYLDHGAMGEKHAGCAAKCIESGLPVGIKTAEKVYLLVGDHKPLNDKLASLAAKTITVTGKVVERDGISMIENAQIVKQ